MRCLKWLGSCPPEPVALIQGTLIWPSIVQSWTLIYYGDKVPDALVFYLGLLWALSAIASLIIIWCAILLHRWKKQFECAQP